MTGILTAPTTKGDFMLKHISYLVSGVVVFASHIAFAAPITNADAAELALHRVERLIALSKIEDTYQKHFQSLTLELLANGGVAIPTFKVVVSQQVDLGKDANKVEIILDEKGKALSYNAAEGEPAASPHNWPDKDPVTLAEIAIHYIEVHSQEAAIAKFNTGLLTVRIEPGTMHGTQVATVQATSSETSDKLNVYIGLDGSFHGVEVVK